MKEKLSKIRWHLEHNFIPPYNDNSINSMLGIIEKLLQGEISLDTPIKENSDITVGEMMDDLRLPFSELDSLLAKINLN